MKPEESGSCRTCRNFQPCLRHAKECPHGWCGIDMSHVSWEDTCPEYHKREEPT